MKINEIIARIKNDIQNEIFGKSGCRFPDTQSLAEKYGVSYVSAIRIIATLKEEKILLPIGNKCFLMLGPCSPDSELFTFLNRANDKKMGIIVPSLTNPFYGEVVEALNATLLKHNIYPFIAVADEQNEIEVMERLARQGCIGLFSFVKFQTPKIINYYSRFPLPIVTIGKKLNNINISSITSDNYGAGEIAAKHLVSCGYEQFAYCVNKNNYGVNNERLNGFINGLKKCGVELPKSHIFIFDHDDAKTGNAILSFLEKNNGTTGFFCYHDITAMDLFFIVKNAGFSVPDKVGIVGYDNLSTLAHEVKLTTFAYSFNKMAELALNVMLEKCSCPSSNNKNVKVQTSMIIRNSTIASD